MLFLESAVSGVDTGWLLIVIAALLNAFVSTVGKYRMNQLGTMEVFPLRSAARYFIRFFKSPLVCLAMCLFIVNPVFWMLALSRLPASVAYPANYALNLFFIFIFSLINIKEKINMRKVAGALLLVVAFYLLYAD